MAMAVGRSRAAPYSAQMRCTALRNNLTARPRAHALAFATSLPACSHIQFPAPPPPGLSPSAHSLRTATGMEGYLRCAGSMLSVIIALFTTSTAQ